MFLKQNKYAHKHKDFFIADEMKMLEYRSFHFSTFEINFFKFSKSWILFFPKIKEAELCVNYHHLFID